MFGSIGAAGVQPSTTSVKDTGANKPKATAADQKLRKSKTTITGQPKTLVSVNGQIFEARPPALEATAVIVYGRFNPPTVGHDRLISEMISIAEQVQGDPLIFTSSSEDRSSNPLSFTQKVAVLREGYGSIVHDSPIISSTGLVGLLAVVEHVRNTLGYDNLIFVTGSDRENKYTNLFKKYNGDDLNEQNTVIPWGEKFNQIVVHSVARDDQSNQIEESVSGSQIRKWAADGDYNRFIHAVSPVLSEQTKDELYAYVRIGQGLANALSSAAVNEQSHVLSAAERVQRARIFARYRQKIEHRREISISKHGSAKVINKRAKKLALELMRKKYSAGQDYHQMPFASRAAIDQRLRGKQRALNTLARKLVPRVKATENRRLQPSAKVNEQFSDLVEQLHPQIATNVTEAQLANVVATLAQSIGR